MKLRKPPVIEAWVDFRFSLDENAADWDEDRASRFLTQAYGQSFQAKAILRSTEFTVQPGEQGPMVSKPQITFERIKAANDADDRYIQAGRDTLIYNMLRKGDVWPDYHILKSEALEAYGKYVAFAGPAALRSIALHYRDLVMIPLGPEGGIELAEYFTVYPQVPSEPFGSISVFSMGVVLESACKNSIMKLKTAVELSLPEPGEEHPQVGRFRMDWKVLCNSPESKEADQVAVWLDQAHADLVRAFRGVFTEEAWKLFEPEDV